MVRTHRLLAPAVLCAAFWAGPTLAQGIPAQVANTEVDACIGDFVETPSVFSGFDCFFGEPFGLDPDTVSDTDSDTGTTVVTSSATATRDSDTATGTATADFGTSVGAESSATAAAGGDDRSVQVGSSATWLGLYSTDANVPGADVDIDLSFDVLVDLSLGVGTVGSTDLSINVGAVKLSDLGDLTELTQQLLLIDFLLGNVFAGTARIDNPPTDTVAFTRGGDLDDAAFDSGITQSGFCDSAPGDDCVVTLDLLLDFNDVLSIPDGETLLVFLGIFVSSQVDVIGGVGGTASTDGLQTITGSVSSDAGTVTLQIPAAPEPATLGLLLAGLVGIGLGWGRRRTQRIGLTHT